MCTFAIKRNAMHTQLIFNVMSIDIDNKSVAAAPEAEGVGDAVGMERRHWFVAIVNHNSEKSSAARLTALGYECFVPVQEECRVWRNGRKARVQRVVIPSTLFVRCSESRRLQAAALPRVFRFLTDKAGGRNPYGKSVAIIPDAQIDTLKFMLGNSDTPVEISERPYGRGDKVRVVRGSLRGLEGEVLTGSNGRSELIVGLDILGAATVSIDPVNLEPILS